MRGAASRRGLILGTAALPFAQLDTPTAAGSACLAAMVAKYEASHAALSDATDRLDQSGTWDDSEWKALIRKTGRQRAAIALHPTSSLADVLLKLRAFMVSRDLKVETADLHASFAEGGHAYDEHVALALVLDLARITRAAA